MGIAFLLYTEATILQQTSGSSGSYSFSACSSEMFPEPWVQEVDTVIVAGHFFLHFDQR